MLDCSSDLTCSQKRSRAAGRNNMFLQPHVMSGSQSSSEKPAVSCIHNIRALCQISTDAKNCAQSAARKRTAGQRDITSSSTSISLTDIVHPHLPLAPFRLSFLIVLACVSLMFSTSGFLWTLLTCGVIRSFNSGSSRQILNHLIQINGSITVCILSCGMLRRQLG